MSVVIHEVSHGYAALMMGDVTAKYAGRLTLNPIKHLDPFGSVILPIVMAIISSGGLVFGWAKPVPYNPYNLRNQRWGELIVALAGPLSNITVAIFFGVLIRFASALSLSASFIELSMLIVIINLVLAVFNLIPIPPLDGSKVLFAVLSTEASQKTRSFLERYGLILVFIFIFFIWRLVLPIVLFLAENLTGINLI